MSLAKLVSIFVSSGVGSKLKLGVRGGGARLIKNLAKKKKVSDYFENVHCKHRRRNLGGGEGLAPIFFFCKVIHNHNQRPFFSYLPLVNTYTHLFLCFIISE